MAAPLYVMLRVTLVLLFAGSFILAPLSLIIQPPVRHADVTVICTKTRQAIECTAHSLDMLVTERRQLR